MKINLLPALTITLICFFICFSLKGQSKYFEKAIGWGDYNEGWIVLSINDTSFLIGGTSVYLSDFTRKTHTLKINLIGDTSALHIYEQNTGGNLIFYDMASQIAGYAITGWMSPNLDNEVYDGFLLLTNPQGEQTALFNIGNDIYNTVAQTMLSTNDGGFLIGGHSIPDESTGNWELWLTKVDSAGDKVWEHTYDYPKENYFGDLLYNPNGGYYAIGMTDASLTSGDLIVLEINELGVIIEDYIYNFWQSDGGFEAITTHDGGILIAGHINSDNWRLFKLDANLNEQWQYEEYASGCVGMVQLPDDTYVITGCYDHSDSLSLQMNITKISPSGTTLWNRFYGDTYNNYGYDLTTTPDGGFIISGRTESWGHADVYIVKTNCMGLLTEPQATFDYTATELTAQFINTSQYVYPDSTDGGHFIWNFGDGSSSADFSTLHTYQSEGYYTVTLTAVVCSDTSVYEQVVAVGAVGVEATKPQFSISPIYPNPATQTAYLDYQIPDKEAFTLNIYDIYGRRVVSEILEGYGVFPIPLEAASQGLLLYTIENKNGILEKGKFSLIK